MARDSEQRWLLLFVVLRLAATALAVTLLIAHRITDHDLLLIVVVVAYGLLTTGVAWYVPRLQGSAAWWALDTAAVLLLVVAGEHWRSPFYLFALTTLVLPTTALPFWRAVAWTAGYVVGYLCVAVVTGVDWGTLETTNRLESFSTHLLLPLVFGIGLAYSSRLLGHLETERRRSEQLALKAERRRLARELHDSAKQRLHAAHLVLTSSLRGPESPLRVDVEQALREIEVAGAELDESLTDLRRTWGDGSLGRALRQRASQLEAASGIPVRVEGDGSGLSPAVATHAFHIVNEAMVNAVRHSGGTTVEARIALDDGRLLATVVDDGRGPPSSRATAHGVRSMVERSELVGGTLEIVPAHGGRGTLVRLDVPIERGGDSA